jgi:glycosyltransferase involved in cell wall biosynthesis
MSKKVLFLSHYAGRTGAPIVLLNHLVGLKKNYPDFECDILFMNGGELIPEFEKIGNTYLVEEKTSSLKIINRLSRKTKYHSFIKRLLRNNYKLVYGNTVAVSGILASAKKIDNKLVTVCHVHELEMAIKEYCGEENFRDAIPFVDHFIAASISVKNLLTDYYKISPTKIHIHYEHIPLPGKIDKKKNDNCLRVFGSGTMDWRKGIDVFIQAAYQLNKLAPTAEFEFCWIGGKEGTLDFDKALYDVQKLGIEHRVKFIPSCPNPWDYLIEADLFLLTSREDPFPLICLEAAALSKPIICFKDTGGMVEFVNAENGWLIDYLDIPKLTDTLIHILNDERFKQKLAVKGELSRLKAREYDIEKGVKKLKEYLDGIVTL